MDMYSVHMQRENIGVQQALYSNYCITMITLPPYSPQFNPAELVFNNLLRRLSRFQASYNTMNEIDFLDAIVRAMDCFDIHDVKAFYKFVDMNVTRILI